MADTPDLMSIGAHCAVLDCHQNDFLPFKCSACKHTFCLEHFRQATHNCSARGSEATAIICPLCALAIKLRSDEDPNAAFEAHSREARGRFRQIPFECLFHLGWLPRLVQPVPNNLCLLAECPYVRPNCLEVPAWPVNAWQGGFFSAWRWLAGVRSS